MKELISYRLHWIARKGNSFFLLIILLLIITAWFVKYPSVVKAFVKITTVKVPKLIVANSDGKLGKILVINEQDVVRGQMVALLKSRANYTKVVLLRSWISQMEASIVSNDSDWLSTNPLPEFTELGNLQSAYAHFRSLVEDVPGIPGSRYHRKEWNELRQCLKASFYNSYRPGQVQKVVIQENKFKIKKVVSAGPRREEELSSAFLKLKSMVNAWVGEYLIIAPESGKIVFASDLKENQRVSVEQKLFYLQPTPMIFCGLMKVARTVGKIQTGQRVKIQVDGYPISRFGYLTGAIGSISTNPSGGDSLLIEINLPEGLQTTSHKSIYFRNNLSANASIEIDDGRLLNKFLGTFKKVAGK